MSIRACTNLRTICVIAGILASLLAGCQPISTSTPPTVEATAVDLAPTSTVGAIVTSADVSTSTSTVTETHTATATSTNTSSPTITSTPSFTPTPTLTPTPSPTPLPAEQMVQGRQYQHDGFHVLAIASFQAVLNDSAAGAFHAEALYRLGQTQIAAGEFDAGDATMLEYIDRFPKDTHADHALVYSATARQQAGNLDGAIEQLNRYVEMHPEVQGYIWKWLGDLYLEIEDTSRSIGAYELAAETAPRLALSVYYRELKAGALLRQEDYAGAVREYEQILDVSSIKRYRSKIQYLTGMAHVEAEQPAAAASRFRKAIAEDQTSSYAHSALVQLLELGEEVDEFLRGMVDYYNAAYWPAVQAFERYLESDPDNRADEAQYYTAASYAGMDMTENAIQEYQAFIDEYPESHLIGEAWRALARQTAWAGDIEDARALYEEFATRFPKHPLATYALLSRADLAEDAGDLELAATEYLELADEHPIHANAAVALHRAGLALYRLGYYEDAAEAWENLSTSPTSDEQKRTALFWAGKSRMVQGDIEQALQYLDQVITQNPHDYYGPARRHPYVGDRCGCTQCHH